MTDKDIIKKLPEIKTRKQLEQIAKDLQDQGFGYMSDYEWHNNKIKHIISNANELNIDSNNYEYELNELVSEVSDDYNEVKRVAKKYFQKFKPDDKIKELLDSFYLRSSAFCSVPYARPGKKDIIEWYRFKKKYNIENEHNFYSSVRVYNLDRPTLKLYGGGQYSYKFGTLYKLVYGEEPNDWSYNSIGNWQDLGEIQIKFYQNGNMDVKGNIQKLKPYLYDQLRDNCIIFYNKKKEIRENKEYN